MADVKTGRPDIEPDGPSHTPGVRQGNDPDHYRRQPGHKQDGTSSARRSTGVAHKHRNTIVPGSPNLSPA